MKLPPRTTHKLALASLLALAPTCPNARALHPDATAQQQPATTAGTKQQPTTNGRAAKTGEQRDARPRRQRSPNAPGQRDAQARERRAREQAVAALLEAAEAVRPADELYESVRLRAEIAEVLWPHDPASARAMLRRAWEAATAPGAEDRVEGFGVSEDPREDARHSVELMRRFVVKAAFRHDPPLAETFMRQSGRELSAESAAEREGDGTEASSSSAEAASSSGAEAAPSSNTRGRARELSAAGWQRLSIATQFLEEGEHERAAAVAAPLVAEGPTAPLLDFISALRASAPRESDALYLRLLERTRADASAGANDVLLLSTPVVSPTLRAQTAPDGSVSFSPLTRRGRDTGDAANGAAAAPMPAEARRAFFNVAAAVLLRARAGAAGGAQRSDEAAQLYFTAARLLPFFEREAPQHAPALHALVASVAADLEAGRRDALASRATVSSLTSKNPADPLASLLKAVASAPNATERDRERFLLVTVAARRGLWDRARAAAAEVEDEETRRHARLVISMRQVMETLRAFEGDDEDGPGAGDKNDRKDSSNRAGAGSKGDAGDQPGASDRDDVERAADFVRGSDVPPEVRAAGFAQAAELAAKRGQPARAAELLDEAATYAEQSERAGGHRTLALSLVALSAARSGDARARDALSALVRAANEEDDFTFAALAFDYTFNHLGRSVSFTPQQDPLDLREVFAAAARLDLARTLAEARALKDEVVRANMLFAAARGVLEKTSKTDAKSAP